MMMSLLCKCMHSIMSSKIPIYIHVYIHSCWLSTEKGTIFAFVTPMIAIILVSYTHIHHIIIIICQLIDQHSVLGVCSGGTETYK